MSAYRRRSSTVDATQYLANREAPEGVETDAMGLYVMTPEGRVPIDHGNFIVTEVDGSKRVYPQTQFFAQFEAVDAKEAARMKAAEASRRAQEKAFGVRYT